MITKIILSLLLIISISSISPVDAISNKQETGLIKNKAGLNSQGAFEGYTLFAPLSTTNTYLINMEGETIHTWEGGANPGNSVYLLENGNLLRTESSRTKGNQDFPKGGAGGKVKMINWDGEIVWEFVHSSPDYLLHHDVEVLPNGNILMIAWERIPKEQAISAGINPIFITNNHIFADKIIEVKPDYKNSGGEIVWEWHMMDHVIQDFDNTKENYGRVFRHPELLDLNFMASDLVSEKRSADWTHLNAIDFNSELSQIAVSSPHMAEIYIINHNTTTEEAESNTGDFLYRWGNPMAYRAGNEKDRTLFFQHDIQWIPEGFPGEGNLLVFNNGMRTEPRKYSTIDEFSPEIAEDGTYIINNHKFTPKSSSWNYTANPKEDFYSSHISGTQRLPNGNTLICSGEGGIFTEVTADGKTVWEYVNPFAPTPKGKKKGGMNNSVFRCYRYAPDYPGLRFDN
ncbi:MAG: aryl-sulfate sulfotransferase [Caldisericia bacterium]|nr:aryl-sulfate sulfotransferase [Caldisericia bacterium]